MSRTGSSSTKDIRGLRVGVVTSLVDAADPQVADSIETALGELRSLGAELVPVTVPLLEHAGTIQQAMQFQEAADVHMEWLRTRLSDYGADVRARLLVGIFLPPAVYEAGRRARARACEEFRGDVRAGRSPRCSVDAGAAASNRDGDSRDRWARDPLPARAHPVQLTLEPRRRAGSQRALRVRREACPSASRSSDRVWVSSSVLRAAHAFQQATDWHERRPALATPGAGRAAPP